VLEFCSKAGLPVRGVGKVGDLYAGRGFDASPHTPDNRATMAGVLSEMRKWKRGVIMANLVDFDTLYGHRRDPVGMAKALQEFDGFLPRLLEAMEEEDILFIVSDHGCDPVHRGTDHTREHALLLVTGRRLRRGVNLGTRSTFADCGKSIAELLGVEAPGLDGTSFASSLSGALGPGAGRARR
jgi:phosphopentomutase